MCVISILNTLKTLPIAQKIFVSGKLYNFQYLHNRIRSAFPVNLMHSKKIRYLIMRHLLSNLF